VVSSHFVKEKHSNLVFLFLFEKDWCRGVVMSPLSPANSPFFCFGIRGFNLIIDEFFDLEKAFQSAQC